MALLTEPLPRDWHQVPLRDVGEVRPGPSSAQLKAAAGEPGTVPVVTPADLRHNRVADDCAEGAAPTTALSDHFLSAGDIVCARVGQLGRQGLVGEHQSGWLLGSTCLRVRVHTFVSAPYLVHYLGHPTVRDWIVRNTSGAVIPTLTAKLLGAVPVAVPPAEVQDAVAETLGALDDKALVHERISETTARLRDALLLDILGRR